MRYAILLLVIVAALTLGGTYLSHYEGYVELGLSDGSYQMPMWYFLLALVVLVVALMIVFKIIWTVIRIPAIAKRFGKNRRTLKAGDLLQKGMLAMGKGQWKKAEKLLVKGSRLMLKAKHDPSLFLTTAAEAAQNQGAEERRNQYLLEARQLSTEGVDTFSSALAEARLHLAAGEPELALASVKPHRTLHATNTQLVMLESEAYEALGRYYDVWQLLSAAKKQFSDKAAYLRRRLDVAKQLFVDEGSQLEEIEKVWSELPKDLKRDEGALLNYISGLIHHGQEEKAEKLLVKEIKTVYADPMIHAYAQLETGSSTEKLSNLRQWLRFRPDNAYLNYGAAKYAFQSEQFEEAKTYAENSIRELAMPETFALLGKICDALGEHNQALAAYRSSANLTYVNDGGVSPVSGDVLPAASDDVKRLTEEK